MIEDELNKQVKTIANIYHEKLTNDNVDSQYLIDRITIKFKTVR